MDFSQFLRENIVLFDGAFGTVLQKKTDKTGTLPELLNLERPELIRSIHEEYAAAGADVITANTFGANAVKTGDADLSDKLVRAAVRIAREAAKDKFVALDIGPTGKLLAPAGELTFEQAYDAFARMVEAGKDGCDLVLIETMSDLGELRAALLAAREHCDLPVLCTMTFDATGRTFVGCDPACYALAASPLADGVGVNCSLGPQALVPVVKRILEYTDKPVIVQANAGLPDENLHYDVSPAQFSDACREFLRMGVRVLGGCCGTTPEYIEKLRALIGGRKPKKRRARPRCAVCSPSRLVEIDDVRVIGERINPTGKKAMKQALLSENYAYVREQAIEQAEAGAAILDVNAGLPELDEAAVLPRLVYEVQAACDLPLQIDCGKADAVERALRACNGKAIVNSVNGEDRVLEAMLPVVKKYGAAVVGLTMDERGIPRTAKERVAIAEKIVAAAKAYGIPREDVFIDCLTLTVSAEQAQARETLRAVREVKKRLGVRTVLGVSNISFGLPARAIVNSSFLTAALFAGLDLPILNPNIPENMQAVAAYRTLSGKDANCAEFSERYANFAPVPARGERIGAALPAPAAAQEGATDERGALMFAIRKGSPDAAKLCADILKKVPPLEVVNDYLIPALNKVGDAFEKGTLFLPQLVSAAECAKGCFAEVKKCLQGGGATGGTIVLATVHGDIHDIGKNIVRTVLENYGYRVIDLGKNVPPEEIVRCCREEKVRLCGLSALMTTTVPAMEATIKLLREQCPDCRVMVGGAVLNADYAKKIGADRYCKDANASVRFAQEVFSSPADR